MKTLSTTKILVIDDEVDMTRAIHLTINVQEPSWIVIESNSGENGLLKLDEEKPDLVLLDLRMPDLNGFEVLKLIRQFSNVPVIILTVDDNELKEVKALDKGADDYIVKPFGHLELLAHIRSVLRRTQGLSLDNHEPYISDNIKIDFNNRIVKLEDNIVSLTSTEFALLEILVQNAGQVIPFEVLLGKIWGHNYLDNKGYLKVYIRKLRLKLEKNPSNPEFIVTVNGLGYKFAESNL
ncbi:MAG: response regulator transcription factor [Spirochaetaceae bacterium]|nr:response regulator transcription factor [Spirochaetaceae bacterium]